MESENQTSRFFLLDLATTPSQMIFGFLVLTAMYVVTLSGNLILITVVSANSRLQTPMYFFLCNLSVIDICFSTTIVPRILISTLSKEKSISLVECAMQMHFHLMLGCAECFILAVMAYDRYAAICRPLHYQTLMNNKTCIVLAAMSWGASFVNSLIHVVYTFQLSFCRSHHVSHFFCEIPPFLQMSCSDDTWLHEVAVYISAGIIATSSFSLILISYSRIVSTILKISSSQRYKAFSTCVSHFTVVTMYYSTIMVMYLRPHSAYSPDIDKSVSLLYTTVTPMLNPIIYSIRNKDVKVAVTENLSKGLFTFLRLPVI